MRIVQVCPFFAPHVGGVESHVALVAAELARRGHELTVLTSRHDRGLPERERDPRGFEIVRLRSLGTLFATPIALGTGKGLRAIPADVVHMHYPPPLTSFFAARALRRSGTPACLTYHCDLYLEGLGGRILSGLYQKVFLPQTLTVARRVIVHSGSYGKTSRYLSGRDLAVIPSLVDTDRFHPRDDDPALRERLGVSGKRIILFVGRLVPHKGVDDLIHAVPDLPEDTVLIVVGGGPETGRLEELAADLALGGRVIFARGVGDRDLPRYYAIASLVVLPSHNRLEGFGLAAADALAAGRPVVLADMPGVRDVVEDGVDGLLAEPLIPEDLARKCAALLGDPDRLREMGRRARENAVSKYSVSVVVDQLEALYRSVLGEGGASPRSASGPRARPPPSSPPP